MERQRIELGEVYERYASDLYRFMLRLTRNREDAADLVQDVFLKLCQQATLPERAREWMATTGYRLFVDRWRRERRAVDTPPGLVPSDVFIAPEQAVLDLEFDRFVRRMLLRFKRGRREALYMRLYEQTSCAEIARLLMCPENTVKSHLRRGRRQLSEWVIQEREIWRTDVRNSASQPLANRS
ncbi:RNA polymerase sigma factor [Paenibacillaceae bacterium WGS1546]|uniref:RNA polymerase sigma factor n=1 Tax=Cohnella sp. WGS1546 TaxID=3366810 RepID=UPI00372D6BD2